MIEKFKLSSKYYIYIIKYYYIYIILILLLLFVCSNKQIINYVYIFRQKIELHH